MQLQTIIHKNEFFICQISNFIDAYYTNKRGKLKSNIYTICKEPYKSVGIYLIKDGKNIVYCGLVHKSTHGFKRIYRHFQNDNLGKVLNHPPFCKKKGKIKIIQIENPTFERLAILEDYFNNLYKPIFSFEKIQVHELAPEPDFNFSLIESEFEKIEYCPF